ncbi:MAG: hypothetical protein ACTSP3_07810 [Candidatus Heimdallarchaeaceae archaeon]
MNKDLTISSTNSINADSGLSYFLGEPKILCMVTSSCPDHKLMLY